MIVKYSNKDHNKDWLLGSNILKEAHGYKYLSVYFSDSVSFSFSYHMNCISNVTLKDKYNDNLYYKTVR